MIKQANSVLLPLNCNVPDCKYNNAATGRKVLLSKGLHGVNFKRNLFPTYSDHARSQLFQIHYFKVNVPQAILTNELIWRISSNSQN
jgi:hypothetical protein